MYAHLCTTYQKRESSKESSRTHFLSNVFDDTVMSFCQYDLDIDILHVSLIFLVHTMSYNIIRYPALIMLLDNDISSKILTLKYYMLSFYINKRIKESIIPRCHLSSVV